jgi:glycerophosphoryl diester phosphodiesterase
MHEKTPATAAAIPPTRVHPVLDDRARRVFAHRGGAALRPENTLAAFDHGMALGADGLELDVRLSRDREVVVFHDERLDRTTNGRGPVAACDYRELAQLDAGWHFGAADRFPCRGQGISIPRLQDVLARYPDAPLIIELKGRADGLAEAAVATVRRAGALSRVCFGSFEDVTIRAARACGADVVTSGAREEIRRAIWASWVGLPPRRPAFRAFQVPERHGLRRVASRRFIHAARRGGVAVQVWTVNHVADMERLLGWGVQGLITDRPDLAVPVVARFNARTNGG